MRIKTNRDHFVPFDIAIETIAERDALLLCFRAAIEADKMRQLNWRLVSSPTNLDTIITMLRTIEEW